MSSFYEFLYSYRKNKDSPLPDLISPESIEALKKIIEIKKTISSGKIKKLTLKINK